ncbi:MAG: 30S ribosomal protein S3 [Planctomycetes bacterium]|nr:30S ribosomal protein S3 [Planctomycetota bacterium]
MGQKVRPIGIRVGITRDWSSRWYADKKEFGQCLLEDAKLRKHIRRECYSAGVSRIEIERNGRRVTVWLHVARPGVVIGRKGARVEQLKSELQDISKGKDIQLNIEEVAEPETDAQLISENVAEQLKKRASFRRVLKQVIRTARERGAKGIKVMVSGRLGGAEMARREKASEGKVPLSTLRADIDYGFSEAITTYGVIGCKVWVYKGEVLEEKVDRRNVADAKTV